MVYYSCTAGTGFFVLEAIRHRGIPIPSGPTLSSACQAGGANGLLTLTYYLPGVLVSALAPIGRGHPVKGKTNSYLARRFRGSDSQASPMVRDIHYLPAHTAHHAAGYNSLLRWGFYPSSREPWSDDTLVRA